MLYNLSNTKVAVTATGGVESTVLAYEIASHRPKELQLLACNYGQATWAKSYELVLNLADNLTQLLSKKVEAVEIPIALPQWEKQNPLLQDGFTPIGDDRVIDYAKQQRTYQYALIQGRNAFLFLHMLSYCSWRDIPVLYAGYQYELLEWEQLDSFRHRTEDFGSYFLDRINLLQEVGFSKRVRIEAPFVARRLSKYDVMKLGRDTYGIDIERATYSCQFFPECGKCENCICRETSLKRLKEEV